MRRLSVLFFVAATELFFATTAFVLPPSSSLAAATTKRLLATVEGGEKTTFATCSNCKAVYVLTENELGKGGCRVRCSVCGNDWHQSPDRLHTLYSDFSLEPYDDEKRKQFADTGKKRSFQRGGGGGQQSSRGGSLNQNNIFVANLPYEASEQDVVELFSSVSGSEVPRVTIVKDDIGRSRGFGFVEVGSPEIVAQAIETLNGANVLGREIVVRKGNGRSRR